MKRSWWVVLLVLAAVAVSYFVRVTEDRSVDFERVTVYLSNSELGSNENCGAVFPVTRTLDEPQDTPIEAAFRELLKGPTQAEEEEGYFSNININTTVRSITITDNTAFIDFSSELNQGVAGSCLVLAIQSQIVSTALQFEEVQGVVISVNGETEGILEP